MKEDIEVLRKVLDDAITTRKYAEMLEHSISEQIKKTRQNLGISQAQLAKNIGISAQYLCDIEQQRRKISDNVLKALKNFISQAP